MRQIAYALTCSALALSGTPAAAVGLSEEACKDLKTEQSKLVDAGARKDMEKGPEWAKANLSPERLASVARLIEVEEGISFRCPRPKPVIVAVPPTPADPAAGAADGKVAKKKATKQVEVPAIDLDLLADPDAAKQPVPKKKKPAVVQKKAMPPARDDFAAPAPAPANTSAAPPAATPK